MRPIVLFALIAGCSGYDPDLGPTPFLCGDDDPRCPSGYECTTIGARDVCVAGDNTFETAYTTSAFTAPIEYGPVEICPVGDKDHWRVRFPAGAMKALRVSVTWDGGTAPTGAILGAGGNPLTNLTSSGSNVISGCAANLPAGDYAARVEATAKMTYNIALSVTDDCGM
jgi:hypothetical protein